MANEDKATRYHRLQRRVSVASTATTVVFTVLLLATGASVWLRDATAGLAGDGTLLAAVLYVIVALLVHELLQLPVSFYGGVTLERRYGLSRQSTGHWWRDQAKAVALGLMLASLAGGLLITFLRVSPAHWWLLASVCFTALVIVLAHLAPVLLLPLFYELKPLDRPALAQRLTALAARAGAPVLGVYEWRLSDRTRKANAAVAGVGRTRRIILSDTLLAEHDDDEIEVVLAHELAHVVHRDLWSAIALEAMLIALACYVADRVLAVGTGWFGFTGKADPAALPLLALAVGAVSLVLLPVANAVARAHERRADRFALESTRNVGAFVTAMKRLAAQNLAEERPSPLVQALFYTHPPISSRIAAAQVWARTSLDSAARPSTVRSDALSESGR